MTREWTVIATLLVYNVVLVLIGVWASGRTRDSEDFYLGGRRLGPIIASISASASSSSAWTLLGVSGAAYLWGVSALWLFPATLLGFLINWILVAPRLMPESRRAGLITLTEFVAGDRESDLHVATMRSIAVIVVFSFLFYIASQFQAAGNALSGLLGMTPRMAVVFGGLVILAYTFLGGFWASSVTDTLQGLLMFASAIILPLGALIAVGGFAGLGSGLAAAPPVGGPSAFAGPAFVGFVLGTLGIGLGYPGQPHVVNRFMALRDERALRIGRIIAISWAVCVYAGMLILGLCGRVLVGRLADGEQIFFAVTNRLFSPMVAGLMIAAVLSAIMSTADSQLLVVASSVGHDWRRSTSKHRESLRGSRIAVVGSAILAIGLAILAPASIYSRVLFAWHAVGSALGPTVLMRLAGRRLNTRAVLASVWIGFAGTVILHWLPDSPGDWMERLIPFFVALGVLIAGDSVGRRSAIIDHPSSIRDL